jgi:hypothetical protein
LTQLRWKYFLGIDGLLREAVFLSLDYGFEGLWEARAVGVGPRSPAHFASLFEELIPGKSIKEWKIVQRFKWPLALMWKRICSKLGG